MTHQERNSIKRYIFPVFLRCNVLLYVRRLFVITLHLNFCSFVTHDVMMMIEEEEKKIFFIFQSINQTAFTFVCLALVHFLFVVFCIYFSFLMIFSLLFIGFFSFSFSKWITGGVIIWDRLSMSTVCQVMKENLIWLFKSFPSFFRDKWR